MNTMSVHHNHIASTNVSCYTKLREAQIETIELLTIVKNNKIREPSWCGNVLIPRLTEITNVTMRSCAEVAIDC